MNKEDLKEHALYFDQQEGNIVKFMGFDDSGRAGFQDGKHVNGVIETLTNVINMHSRIQHKICEQLDEKEK